MRKTLPQAVISLLSDLSSTSIYANIEYEVDELRRDLKVCALAKEKGIQATFVHDKCVIEPGLILTKEKKAYAVSRSVELDGWPPPINQFTQVYSPYQRNWLATLQGNQGHYLQEQSYPEANDASIKDNKKFAPWFSSKIPKAISGFELASEDAKTMEEVWPAGEDVASRVCGDLSGYNSSVRIDQNCLDA